MFAYSWRNMPSKPRSLHLPASGSSAPTAKPVVRKWVPPKPHLANLHFESGPSAFASGSPSSSSSSSGHFVPPASPQLPARRKPAFSPGGFGLQFQPPPAPGLESAKGVLGNLDGLGKGKGKERAVVQDEVEKAALSEVERRRREIEKEEERMEGRVAVEEGKEEAEACYVVSLPLLVAVAKRPLLKRAAPSGDSPLPLD